MNILNKYTVSLFLVTSVLFQNAVNAEKMGSRRPIGQLSKAFKQENLQKVLSGAAWLWSSLGRDTVSYDQGSTTGGNYDYVDPEEDEGEGQEQYPHSGNSGGSGSSKGGSGNGGGKKPNQEQDPIITSTPLSEEEQSELNQAFFEAVSRNQLDRVQALLSRGASVNAVKRIGYPGLHIVACGGYEEILKRLLVGRTALHTTVFWRHLGTVKFLVEKNSDSVGNVDSTGHTALHLAIFMDDLDMVRYLIAMGANVDNTAIVWACGAAPSDILEVMMNAEIARLLITCGPIPSAKEKRAASRKMHNIYIKYLRPVIEYKGK